MSQQYQSPSQSPTPAVSPPSTGALSEQDLYGNQHLQSELGGSGAGTPTELASFLEESFAIQDFVPSSGMGRFDASYVPDVGAMEIVVAAHFEFIDGNPARMPGFPPEDYQWTPQEQEDFRVSAMDEVRETWSDQFRFRNTTAGWEELPEVEVGVHIVDTPDPAIAQVVFKVVKWPEEGQMRDRYRPGNDTVRLHEDASDGVLVPDTEERTTGTADKEHVHLHRLNPEEIYFRQGEEEAHPRPMAELRRFAQALADPKHPPFPLEVDGHASSEGDERFNQDLSERRARNIGDAIQAESPQTEIEITALGETGAAPENRRVEIWLQSFETEQTTFSHEFGHVLGLKDEYVDEEAGRFAGDEVSQPGGMGDVARNDEGIMSQGDEVQPQHYGSILEALEAMTGQPGAWAIVDG